MEPVTCPLCIEPIEYNTKGYPKKTVTLICDHAFHKKCFSQFEAATKKKNTYPRIDFVCPCCRGLPIILEAEKGPGLFERLLKRSPKGYEPIIDPKEMRPAILLD